MAVYTQISEQQLKDHLYLYDIGALRSFEGIEAGVSNTNYFVTTDKDRYVLTLFEPHRVRGEDIPFFINYAIVLEKSGVPCPATILQKDGKAFSNLCDRPAAFFSVLKGNGGRVEILTPELCEKGGRLLARMHLAAASGIHDRMPNHFGLERWETWVDGVGERMNEIAPDMFRMTRKELAFVKSCWPRFLPSGAIHGDFFADNVFFQDGNITGVIDFHFVCTDLFVYDLAIAMNAWCFDEVNTFQPNRLQSLLKGYNQIKPLSPEEKLALPILLRAASLRFLLSRIEEKLKWKPGDFMKPHDPLVFEKRLKHFQTFALPL